MKLLIFLGTVRDSTPLRPARLGERVARFAQTCLKTHYPNADIELIDALDYPLEPIFKPHFAYAKSSVPPKLETLAEKIQSADTYVMVSPEYNHSMSPALANLLNHFGSSLFAYKPSAIVTYSAGQWGGMRAAVNMRTFLAELGSLPVSAMIHVPKAQTVFTPEGAVQANENKESWVKYFSRTFAQLMWWAEATQTQRLRVDPHQHISDFTTTPTARNAP